MGGTITKTRAEGRLHDPVTETDAALPFISAEQRGLLRELGVADALTVFTGDSVLLQPENWTALAQAIAARAGDYAGFIVSHGTDTLAYTASALSWMVGALAKPIVITGAQIAMRDPLAFQRSDGWANLVNAARVAHEGRIAEVSIVFGSRVLRGNRATKSEVFSLDAFRSPNYPDLARLGIGLAYAAGYQPPALALRQPSIPAHWPRVAAVKVFPGVDLAALRAVIDSGVDGLLVEAYSSGMLPPAVLDLLAASGRLCLLTVPAAVAQTNAFLTEPSYWLEKDLLVSGRDMTREAALTKLLWALAVEQNQADVVATLKTALAGEMQAEVRPYLPPLSE
jgi:L-asparaginase/Glu-tRNA(Gln) amidotransferase subunit D